MKELFSEKILALGFSPYTLNQVLFEKSTPGTYTLNIDKGIFEVSICGAGGGGGGSATSHSWLGSNGGSGAAKRAMSISSWWKFPPITAGIRLSAAGLSAANRPVSASGKRLHALRII